MADRYLIANWKMNLPPEGVDAYLNAVGAARSSDVQMIIAPPFPYIADIASKTSLPVAAQNCGDRDKGAFTGEVSAAMLHDCGAKFVIVGHSERRQIYGESDAMIARKLSLALTAGLTPILCIGEELRTREAGQVPIFLAGQIRAAAEGGLDAKTRLVVAYEPVWAIGTGRNASGVMISDTVEYIRDAITRFWPDAVARCVSILYGGSVTPDNVHDLETNAHIDGYLCGGASLDSSRFLNILRGMQRS